MKGNVDTLQTAFETKGLMDLDQTGRLKMPIVRKFSLKCVFFSFALLPSYLLAQLPSELMAENLAPKALITADSEFSEHYSARFVADGKIPPLLSKADLDSAWAVNGRTHRNSASISFQWPEPVEVAQIVYFGRTAWFVEECWKNFQIFIDNQKQPVCQGSFQAGGGPQVVLLPKKLVVKKLTIKFTSSYGGPNPGASEIMIFPRRMEAKLFGPFIRAKKRRGVLSLMPWVDQVDPEALRELILRLKSLHGPRYEKATSHLTELRKLEKLLQGSDPEAEKKLSDLQRRVLLFDVQKLLVIKRHEILATHVYTYHYEGFRPGGGLYVFDLNNPQSPRLLVDSPIGQILDCDLSYDGKRVLFSWRRKREEGYHLWTIDINGEGLQQLTDGRWHDYNACWLPDGGIAFLSTRTPQFAYCWHAPVGVLYRMDADGSNVRRLSANYLNDFTPHPLPDGRIIYTRWEYVDRPAIPIQSLWTINPDGTCLSAYFGNRVISPGTFMDARPIPGTDKIICTMTGHNGPTRGAIGVIDRSFGPNAQQSIKNLTPDVPIPPVDKGNGNTSGTKQYSCPYPLDSLRFICSIRGPILVRSFDGRCQSLVLPAPEDGMQYFYAQPVRPRPLPPVIPNRVEKTDSERSAVLYIQDIYRGLEPWVKRGEVVRIRVVRELQKQVRIDPSLRAFGFQFPVISCGATYAAKMVLGEVPVGPGGSVAFRVPSQVPIYFMALDKEGRCLQRMRSFTHLAPGEVQGCVGCHESRRTTPLPSKIPNLAKILELEKPEWGVRGFDYVRVVQPVLDKHCVRCHNPYNAPKGVDLTGDRTDFFNVSYDVLARENQGPTGSPYVNWIPTYNGQEQNILKVKPRQWGSPRSKLADIVLTGHPDSMGRVRVKIKESEKRRILAWIDLNVPYYGTSETAYPEMKGCRRLYPKELDRVLKEVASRRCNQCHRRGIPRRVWTRITRPHLNSFLLAPLSKKAGGTQRCGKAVFETRQDPDYQKILKTFDPIYELIKRRPRMDMPGAKPAPWVCRDAQ